MIRNLFACLLLVTLVCIPASAMETKCVVTGPAGSYLADIARVAAGAQNQAEEMEAYLRNSSAKLANSLRIIGFYLLSSD